MTQYTTLKSANIIGKKILEMTSILLERVGNLDNQRVQIPRGRPSSVPLDERVANAKAEVVGDESGAKMDSGTSGLGKWPHPGVEGHFLFVVVVET